MQTLHSVIDEELKQAVPQPVTALSRLLAERGSDATAFVLFYGSALRTGELDGVLDFYVLLDRISAWPGSRIAAVANCLLPPNVGYFEGDLGGVTLRAKYAVMSYSQFLRGMSDKALDTSLWARFSQPCACVWARSKADHDKAAAAVTQAVVTAASWAARLGPACAPAVDFWRCLFARTYAAELRVERTTRSDIVDQHSARYSALLPEAWKSACIDFEMREDARLLPHISSRERLTAARRWKRRARMGKPLNVLRLLKAAFTFDGAMDYVVWKVERHSGVRLEVSPWQRRFPLLAAPSVYWQLRKRGVLR